MDVGKHPGTNVRFLLKSVSSHLDWRWCVSKVFMGREWFPWLHHFGSCQFRHGTNKGTNLLLYKFMHRFSRDSETLLSFHLQSLGYPSLWGNNFFDSANCCSILEGQVTLSDECSSRKGNLKLAQSPSWRIFCCFWKEQNNARFADVQLISSTFQLFYLTTQCCCSLSCAKPKKSLEQRKKGKKFNVARGTWKRVNRFRWFSGVWSAAQTWNLSSPIFEREEHSATQVQTLSISPALFFSCGWTQAFLWVYR